MKPADWKEEIDRQLEVRNKASRAEGLLELATKTKKHARAAISAWHEQQAIGLAAATLEDAGQHERAAQQFERLAKLHRIELTFHGQAIVFALARAALLRFGLGQIKPAKALSREALRIFGDFPTVNPFIEEVLGELRSREE